MPNMIDFDGKEYLVAEARGRLRHSKLLSDVKARGDLLLVDINTGSLIIKKKLGFDNLFIHRHRGDTFIRIPLDENQAFCALRREIEQGFMTSYLIRKFPGNITMRIFAADIFKSSVKVKKEIKRIVHGL